jgi:TP901-1 family phage major tail protein
MGDEVLPNGTAVLVLVPDPGNPGQFIPLEAQGDFTQNESMGSIDTSSKDGRARTVDGGRYESSVSLSLLYRPSGTAQAAIKTAFRNATKITLRRAEEGEDIEEASALITQHNLDAPDQDRSEISIEADIDGEWTAVSS